MERLYYTLLFIIAIITIGNLSMYFQYDYYYFF